MVKYRFENEVYHITEQLRPDIPVYKVEAEYKERTLHRNLLFLIDNQGDQKNNLFQTRVQRSQVSVIV